MYIYEKTGADYANEMARTNGIGDRAKKAANYYTLSLMVQHLRLEHGIKVNELVKRFGMNRSLIIKILAGE